MAEMPPHFFYQNQNPMYKHYSFDLWLTLIKSNPAFKEHRAMYIYEKFNPKHLSFLETVKIIQQIDVMCNFSNEATGNSIQAYQMYAMVLSMMGSPVENLSMRDLQSIYHYIETIFEKYSPVPFDENTISTLEKIKKTGASISVLSNTGFIAGFTLEKFLHRSGISKYIDFAIYSDQVGISKPDPQLFSHYVGIIQSIRKMNPILITEIVHVGDNPHADIMGAKRAGIAAIQINSNNKTIKDIL